jgi:hypothetical protein
VAEAYPIAPLAIAHAVRNTSLDRTVMQCGTLRIPRFSALPGVPMIRYCGSTPYPKVRFPGVNPIDELQSGQKKVCTNVITPRFQWDRPGIKFTFILKKIVGMRMEQKSDATHVNDHLLSRFPKYYTRLTPREVVHPPERI